jgi:hypothetical protein
MQASVGRIFVRVPHIVARVTCWGIGKTVIPWARSPERFAKGGGVFETLPAAF